MFLKLIYRCYEIISCLVHRNIFSNFNIRFVWLLAETPESRSLTVDEGHALVTNQGFVSSLSSQSSSILKLLLFY